LDRALDEQSPGDPVVLVGHSVGGLVAAAEALRSPRHVRGLVLVETALAPHAWETDETWEHAAKLLGYAHIPKLRGMRIEDCGHFVMLDRPRRLAEAIRRFSSSVDSAYALN